MKANVLILLLGLSFPLVSLADIESSCNKVDLSSSEVFSNREIIDQHDIGWCYAFSIADLLSQKTGKQVSPYDLAIRYNAFVNNKFEEGNFEGGNSFRMRELLQKEKWVCSEQSYGNVPANAYLHYEAREYKRLREISLEDCSHDSYVGSGIFKNIKSCSNVLGFVYNSSDFSDYLRKLNEKNCAEKIAIDVDLEVKDQRFCGWNDVTCQEPQAQYIRDKLNHGKMVSIGFDPTLLFNLKLGFWDKQLAHFGVRNQHEVTLIGKHEENGKCVYMVHDSSFGAKEVCLANKVSAGITCLDNYIYEVPEAIILNSLKSTAVIKD